MPCTSRIFFPQNYNIFSVLSIFKYNPGKNIINIINLINIISIINLSLLNHFYSVISHRRVGKESDELLYTVWSLVMVREPAQKVN